MAAVFDDGTQKSGLGAVYPDNATSSEFQEGEPLITPDQLRARHLFGIPLVSAMRDPVTHKVARMDDPQIKDFIDQAVALAEAETGIDLFPKRYEERHPYDKPAMNSFGYFVLRHRPAAFVESVAVVSSDGLNVMNVPREWVDTGLLHSGQVNLVPFSVSAATGTSVPIASPSGVGLLPNLFRFHWIPQMWTIAYTTGYPGGKLPKMVNQLVGCIAAMEILSALATTYSRLTSASLGIDGLSQSQSLPGAQIFVPRLTDLAAKRKWLVGKIKVLYGMSLFSDNV